MRSAEIYKYLLEALGLGHGKMAQLCGIDERSSRRWAYGEREVPMGILLLLMLMDLKSVNYEEAMEMRRQIEEKLPPRTKAETIP